MQPDLDPGSASGVEDQEPRQALPVLGHPSGAEQVIPRMIDEFGQAALARGGHGHFRQQSLKLQTLAATGRAASSAASILVIAWARAE